MSSVDGAKRSLEEADKEDQSSNSKRKKVKSYVAINLQWKLWILKNYTFQEGSLILFSDILEYAEKEKERFEMITCLSRITLGLVLHHLWDNKVKRVKRGPRGYQKKFYLNIARKQNQQVQSSNDDLRLVFEEMARDNFILSNGWFKIVDNQTKISLVHPESWEFENQRIYTEISMELSLEIEFICVIKSHGNEVSLRDLMFERILGDLPVKVRANLLVEFLESTNICFGCHFHGDTMMTLVPHKAGLFKSLTEPEKPPHKAAFSSKCKVISSVGKTSCTQCSSLSKNDRKRKERKEKRTSIHKHCNKRYLTKEEIQLQLKEEQKLNKKQLQEQQSPSSGSEDDESHASESEDEDSSSHDSCPEEWMIRNDSKGLTLYRV